MTADLRDPEVRKLVARVLAALGDSNLRLSRIQSLSDTENLPYGMLGFIERSWCRGALEAARCPVKPQ